MVSRRKKSKKYEQRTMLVLIALSICVFILMLMLVVINSDEMDSGSNREVAQILKGDPGVAGRSCGILSELEAKNIIPARELKGTFSNEPLKNKVMQGSSSERGIHWFDSCRYVDSTNSNVYAELFIETYGSEIEAIADFRESLPKVGTIEEIESKYYDELIYSSGAWFARDGMVIIKVSANDGRSGDLKEFSENVFVKLTSEL